MLLMLTMTAPSARAHTRAKRADQRNGSEHVDLEDAAPVGDIGAHYARPLFFGGSVIDQDVDGAGLHGQFHHVFLLTQVRGNDMGGSSRLLDLT